MISISLFKDKDVKIYSIASLRSVCIKISGPWFPVQARAEQTEILIFCKIYYLELLQECCEAESCPGSFDFGFY